MGFKSYKSLGSQNIQNAGSKISALVEATPLSSSQTFLSNGTFTIDHQTTVYYLIVAGGGGGGDNGDYASGGGGAGGYQLGSFLLDAGSYPVVVGDGGLGGTTYDVYVNKVGGEQFF